MPVLIHDNDLSIRLMRDDLADDQIMARWLSDPRVLEFYEGRDHPFSLEQIKTHYAPRLRSEEDATPCLIIFQSAPIGYIQFYLLTEGSRISYGLPSDYSIYSVYGIDQYLIAGFLSGSLRLAFAGTAF